MTRERNPLLTRVRVVVYAFLFAPIVILIIFSFNDSRRNFEWRASRSTGTRPCSANDELLDALFVTLRLALVAVIVSTIIGTLLGLGARPDAVPRSRRRPRRSSSCRW